MINYSIVNKHFVIIGVASYGALENVPSSTSNNLIFSIHFRASQSPAATLCGCISKHICSLYCVVSFYMQQIVFVQFSAPLALDPGDATDCNITKREMFRNCKIIVTGVSACKLK